MSLVVIDKMSFYFELIYHINMNKTSKYMKIHCLVVGLILGVVKFAIKQFILAIVSIIISSSIYNLKSTIGALQSFGVPNDLI